MGIRFNNKINTILFDLDGTLIGCNVKIFAMQYLNGISKALSHLIPPKKVISLLIEASSQIEKNDGTVFNEEIFRRVFFSKINIPEKKIKSILDKYYENEFPKLKKHFQRKPEARLVMEKAFNRGYNVIIATTPILPKNDIIQRLEWADINHFPYRLITSIENSKASKSLSHLTYYQHILDALQLPGKECLMVGDEAKDMIAAKLEYQTFLIRSPNTKLNDNIPKPTYQGTLNDLIKML